jgi:hypothetical protein
VAWPLQVGAACSTPGQCGGSLTCVDDGTGSGVCEDQSSSQPRICDPSDSNSCNSDPNYSSCGSARDNSQEMGVSGGDAHSDCATGVCDSDGYCSVWGYGTCEQGDSCSMTTQYEGDLVCVNEGTGYPSCQDAASRNGRICQMGIPDSCDADPRYPNCGCPREFSNEPGVCGGQDAYCEGGSLCVRR